MKRFRYSMQRVLDVRDAFVSRHESLVAESQRQLDDCRREQRQCNEAVRAYIQQAETVDTAPLQAWLARRAWFCHLADRLCKSTEEVRQKTANLEKRREFLRRAVIDRSVLETMSHRERSEWLARLRDVEAKLMDEAAATVFLRGKTDDGNGGNAGKSAKGSQ